MAYKLIKPMNYQCCLVYHPDIIKTTWVYCGWLVFFNNYNMSLKTCLLTLLLMAKNLNSELVPGDATNFKTKAGYKYTGEPEV